MGGYLVCEQCGGYYELQEGESPEDFEACECGGELKYTNSIHQQHSEPLKKFCKHCGYKNDGDTSFCKKCGALMGEKSKSEVLTPSVNKEISSTTKILIVAVIILVFALSITAGALMVKTQTPANNTTLDNKKNDTKNASTTKKTTQKSQSTETQANSNQIAYGGEYYTIYDENYFNFVGEGTFLCPNCGEKVFQITRITRGNYWYYLYKCSNCGRKFANHALVQ